MRLAGIQRKIALVPVAAVALDTMGFKNGYNAMSEIKISGLHRLVESPNEQNDVEEKDCSAEHPANDNASVSTCRFLPELRGESLLSDSPKAERQLSQFDRSV